MGWKRRGSPRRPIHRTGTVLIRRGLHSRHTARVCAWMLVAIRLNPPVSFLKRCLRARLVRPKCWLAAALVLSAKISSLSLEPSRCAIISGIFDLHLRRLRYQRFFCGDAVQSEQVSRVVRNGHPLDTDIFGELLCSACDFHQVGGSLFRPRSKHVHCLYFAPDPYPEWGVALGNATCGIFY